MLLYQKFNWLIPVSPWHRYNKYLSIKITFEILKEISNSFQLRLIRLTFIIIPYRQFIFFLWLLLFSSQMIAVCTLTSRFVTYFSGLVLPYIDEIQIDHNPVYRSNMNHSSSWSLSLKNEFGGRRNSLVYWVNCDL